MEVHEIFLKIFEQPDAKQFYKNLQLFYESKKLDLESNVIAYLIEKKFKNEHNGTDTSQK